MKECAAIAIEFAPDGTVQLACPTETTATAGAVATRATLIQVLVKADAGPASPEPATRAVLAADPGPGPARHNLSCCCG